MRSIWTGTISFGLVSIPIKLYAAIEHKSIGFRMLCKKCQTPVHYKKYCEGCKSPLENKDIVKGLEISKGEYIVFTKEELDKMRPEKSDRIEIKEFTDREEIDAIYFDKPYFCGPSRAKERSYFLFKEVLETSGKVAIGKFVMREKEHVCALMPYNKGLILYTLNYKYEVRDINDIKELKEVPELNKAEIDLAIKLVNQLYEEEFNIAAFKDTFSEQLKEMLDNKEKIVAEEPKKHKAEEKPLLEALKASLK